MSGSGPEQPQPGPAAEDPQQEAEQDWAAAKAFYDNVVTQRVRPVSAGARGSGGGWGWARGWGRLYPALAPQPKPQNAITVAVSSRALFNLVEERKIYEEHGLEKYVEYQQNNENVILKPGPAFYFVKVSGRGPGRAVRRGGRSVWGPAGRGGCCEAKFREEEEPETSFSGDNPASGRCVWELLSRRRAGRGGAAREHLPHLCAPWPRGHRCSPLSRSLSSPCPPLPPALMPNACGTARTARVTGTGVVPSASRFASRFASRLPASHPRGG